MAFNISDDRPNSVNNFDVMQFFRGQDRLCGGKKRVFLKLVANRGINDEWTPFVIQASSIFFRMLAFVLLAMAPGVDHDKKKNYEADSEENNHPRTIFPNLLNSIRKLGPIHV